MKVQDWFIERQKNKNDPPRVIVVPGFDVPDDISPHPLHFVAKYRLKAAAKRVSEQTNSIIFVSGGNAGPERTPYNEAMEMKRHLMEKHNIPASQIAIDPNAQNSVTNIRNAGRFLLAHGFKEGLIVTALSQNFYYSFSSVTGFGSRMEELLGYDLGEITISGFKTATYYPSWNVMKKSESKIDP